MNWLTCTAFSTELEDLTPATEEMLLPDDEARALLARIIASTPSHPNALVGAARHCSATGRRWKSALPPVPPLLGFCRRLPTDE